MHVRPVLMLILALGTLAGIATPPGAQTPPSAAEIEAYRGLFASAIRNDAAGIARDATPASLAERDGHGRTALHVAAHARAHAAARALIAAGADLGAKDSRAYDVVTIAAVADDREMLRIVLSAGANARAITSPYDGTALIAAAHLGHAEVVELLIAAGAPLDQVNNLGWTAVIEAIVLGDGGPRHQATLAALIRAGASLDIADHNGVRPLALARSRGHAAMVEMLTAAGARP